MQILHLNNQNSCCSCKNNPPQMISYLKFLVGPVFTTAWRVLGLRVEETASRCGGNEP